MLHGPTPRLRRLVLAVACAVAIGFCGGPWTTAAASQTAVDPPQERSEAPKLDELLDRFPIGTERVPESPQPAPPGAAVSVPREASGSEPTWIIVLAGAAGALVLLAAVGAVVLRGGRAVSYATSTPGLTLLYETLALANQEREAMHPAAPVMRGSPRVNEVSQDRNPQRPELRPAQAEPSRQADARRNASAPARDQDHTRVGDRVATTLIKKAVEPAANGGVAQRAAELEALLPADEVDYIERNRAAWERWAPGYAAAGREAWQEEDLRWGIWGIPESALRIFEGLEPGADVIELGCGTAVVSAWLARRRVRPVAIDIAPAQLRTADSLQREFRLSFPLVCANAEQVQFGDASFDLAISEYGASVWCNPPRWLSEAHRLLRPGGRLVFFTNGALLMACTPIDGGPAGDRLVRDYFSKYRVEFPGYDAVEFHLTHGDWVRLLRATGFELENLIEVRPPPRAKATRFEFASLEWARRWPSEEIWVARKAVWSSFAQAAPDPKSPT